jgi:uncharacterized protein YecE (DUF72 family)
VHRQGCYWLQTPQSVTCQYLAQMYAFCTELCTWAKAIDARAIIGGAAVAQWGNHQMWAQNAQACAEAVRCRNVVGVAVVHESTGLMNISDAWVQVVHLSDHAMKARNALLSRGFPDSSMP